MSHAYEQMLRDLVREQGEPAEFDPKRVQLSDYQLSIVIRDDADVLVESAASMQEDIASALTGGVPHGFDSPQEYIGYLLIARMRDRSLPGLRRALACKADDMANEDADDDRYHRGAA